MQGENGAGALRGGVVVGTDGSPSAREAVRQAAALAVANGAVLHLVGGHAEEQLEQARVILQDGAREVARPGLRVWCHAVAADPVSAICSTAERVGAELVVVGNRGSGDPRSAANAICRQVEAAALCSVMVIDTERYWNIRPLGEPIAPARTPRLSRETKVLIVSTVAVFMALLDTTIVNIAFPSIHRSFPGSSLADLSWVLNAYNVVVAALLVPLGRLADRIGRRRVFLAGMGVFLFGSALCGIAPSAGFLIGARALQGIGAATLIPASFSLVLAAVAPERRAMATSVWAAAGAVAAAAGPSLGGVLVQSAGWRWAFFVNLVIGVLMVPGQRVLEESRDPEVEAVPDIPGATMLALGIGALALGIVKAPDWGWGSLRTLGLYAFAAIVVGAVLRRSRRHPSPVLELELLRIRSFATANLATLIFSMGFYALLLGNILFLTEVWGYSTLHAGFAVTPGPLMAAVAAAIGGRLTEHRGPRVVALPALLLFCLACLVYRGVGPVPAYLTDWLPAQLVSGAAIGLTFAGLTSAGVMDLPPNRLATGTAIQSLFRQLGAVLGIALLIAVLGTPGRASVMHVFEHAWLLMAASGLVAALLAAGLTDRRPGEVPVPANLRRRTRAREVTGMERHVISLHGHQVVYRTAGSGPVVLLVHGLLEDSRTWVRLAPALALNHTVIAPDLLGHGESDGPLRVDYSPGGHAVMLRDLMVELGIDQFDVVGHSLGGAIALALAMQQPGRVRSLSLIAPGGFGRELTPLLRLVSVPGTGVLLRAACSGATLAVLRGIRGLLRRLGLRGAARAVAEVQRVLTDLSDQGGRRAFLRSVRTVIDTGGQAADALDRLESMGNCPALVLWGTRDRVIPPIHAQAVADRWPGSEVVLLDGIGHLPHLAQPAFVAERITTFLATERVVRRRTQRPSRRLTDRAPAERVTDLSEQLVRSGEDQLQPA